ncbi:MAG: hypothetical protein LBU88_04685 [Treponema sp.]|jgi:hypothetical protein|nr:hypothetical protein [Treponema sp.]
MKTIKITAIIAALGMIFLVLSLAGCFSDYEGGGTGFRITIIDPDLPAQMGTSSSARQAAFGYAGDYIVTLTNAFGETITQGPVFSGTQIVDITFRLAPGPWTIEIRRGWIDSLTGEFSMTKYGRVKDFQVRTNMVNEVEIVTQSATDVSDWATFNAIFNQDDHLSSLKYGGIIFITNDLIADSTLSFKYECFTSRADTYTILPMGNRKITSISGTPVFQLPFDDFCTPTVILGMEDDIVGLDGLIGTLTITGGAAPALIEVEHGTLKMNSGVVITGNSTGGGVKINSGAFEMNGGTISGNTGFDVYIEEDADFTQNGGTIGILDDKN